MLALLYDVHGNAAALEAVLDDADRAGATRYLVGGDVVAFGPRPAETLDRLKRLPDATWIRGNADRWLVETPGDRPDVWRGLHEACALLAWEDVEWLYSLPTRAEIDGVVYVHGCPLSDCDTFGPAPSPDDERRLAGVAGRTVVFGHSHQQFPSRPGPRDTLLLNPGSVGQPFDGDTSAAYAVVDEGRFDLRRVRYDHRAAAAEMRELGEWADTFARRIETASA